MKEFIRERLRQHPRLKKTLLEIGFTTRRYLQHPQQAIQEVVFRDYSQFGETRRIRRLLGGGSDRYLAEVGANDGKHGSASYGLLLDGWRGLMIEPCARTFERLSLNMKPFARVACAKCAVTDFDGQVRLWHGNEDPTGNLATISTDQSPWFERVRSSTYEVVETRRLTALFRHYGVPKDLDLLVIDAEGMDFEVLRSLDFSQYRPRLIVTEDYRPKNPAKFALLESLGYCLADSAGCNTFWVNSLRASGNRTTSLLSRKACFLGCPPVNGGFPGGQSRARAWPSGGGG